MICTKALGMAENSEGGTRMSLRLFAGSGRLPDAVMQVAFSAKASKEPCRAVFIMEKESHGEGRSKTQDAWL